MLEVGFKPNSTPQNQLVRWGLHLTYILWIVLISSRCGTSNTSCPARKCARWASRSEPELLLTELIEQDFDCCGCLFR